MNYHNPTLRVLKILELIDKSTDGISLSEISSTLEMPQGTISPILKTLLALNYVRQTGNLYRIDFASFELGLSYSSENNALTFIRRQMREIVSEIGEICQMGVLRGRDVYYLLKENANTFIQINSNVGMRMPAHITGLGKALLSGLSDDEVRRLYEDYEFISYTPQSITDMDVLLGQLDEVRKKGFAYENEESTPDICCVAVPLEENGRIRAAISVTIPKFRYSEEMQKDIIKLLGQKKKLIEENCFVQNVHMDF